MFQDTLLVQSEADPLGLSPRQALEAVCRPPGRIGPNPPGSPGFWFRLVQLMGLTSLKKQTHVVSRQIEGLKISIFL